MELQELHSYIQEHQPNICQISVLQNGNELYSAEWNGYQKTDCVHIASDTKSVMALLIGIAIDHKMIGIAQTNEQRNAVETSFTERKTEIGRQFEYNTYIRDFFADNPRKSLHDAIVCWNYKKGLPGHHRYEQSDLCALDLQILQNS